MDVPCRHFFRRLYSIRAAVAVTSIVISLVLGSCTGVFYPAKIAADVSDVLAEGQVMSDVGDVEIFPAEVAGLHLVSTVKGEDAMSLIVSFLGSGHDIKDTYIACYNGDRHELVFWIVEMNRERDSRALFERIQGRILGSPQFSNHQEYSSNLVSSMIHYSGFSRQDSSTEHNFYYRNGSRVYWTTVRGDQQLETLKHFLDQF